jgi:hypothetical protein
MVGRVKSVAATMGHPDVTSIRLATMDVPPLAELRDPGTVCNLP